MPKFIVLYKNELVKTYDIDEPIITIGRLPENTICISNMGVSRRHAKIERDSNNAYILTDMNSLNGSIVNEEKRKKTTLSNGDKIAIGKYSIVFEEVTQAIPKPGTVKVKTDTTLFMTGTYEELMTSQQPQPLDKTPLEQASKENESVLIEINKHVVYKLDKVLVTLGDSENDDIFVSGFLVDQGHVIIERKENELWIRSQKLLGQFKVNGRKTKNHRLCHKDRIEIGSSTFRYMENA